MDISRKQVNLIRLVFQLNILHRIESDILLWWRTKTELEYAVDLKTVLDLYHIKRIDIEGCIISSVVPQITNAVKLAAEKVLKKEPMVLGPGVKTGLNILMDNPGQLGADLVANAVAGIHEYSLPLAIIDKIGRAHV